MQKGRNSPRAALAILLLGALLCAGLLGFIRHVRGDRRAIEELTLALQARSAARAAARLHAQPTAAIQPNPAVAPDSAKPAPTPPLVSTTARRPPDLMDLARDQPQLMNLWVADMRSRLQQRYGVLFQNLGLPPAQRDQFKDIIAANVARGSDIGVAAKEKHLSFDDPVIRQLNDESTRQMDAELTALLGPENFRAYQEFNRTVQLRGFVDGFAVQVASTDPLNAQQAEQLAQALIAATPSLAPAAVDWERVDRAAADFLTPGQLAAWKLGVAGNPYGGSRLNLQMKRVYDAALAREPKP